MKTFFSYIALSHLSAKRPLLLLALVLFFAAPAIAQNSKGDKPATQNNILRFRKIKSKSKGGDRANTRDISGRRRVRTKNKSSANHIIYQNSNPVARRRGSSGDRANTSGTRFRARIRSVSAQRARANVYPQNNKYVHNPAKTPQKESKPYTRTVKGKPVARRVPTNRQRAWTGNLRGGSIGSASASRPFLTRGRKNVYWGKFSKGERPMTRDLTGRPVRTRNFHSAALGTGRSDTMKFAGRKPSVEGGNGTPLRGGYSSISKTNQRGWIGDISGHRLRRRFGKNGQRSGSYRGPGAASASGFGSNAPLPVRRPGIGATGISRFLSRLGGGKHKGGGGSVSGSWNNNGRAIVGKSARGGGAGNFQGNFNAKEIAPGYGRQGSGFSGNIKSGRRSKGGGSVSGNFFNNGGNPLQSRAPGKGSMGAANLRGKIRKEDLSFGYYNDGTGFAGNTRARRAPKGGGSVSGKFMLGNRVPLAVRIPGAGSKGIGYAGNLKGHGPSKGGGSVSGKFMLGNRAPLAARIPGAGSKGINYTGNLKGHGPSKGGGSVSGKFMLGNRAPLAARIPGRGSKGINYTGNLKGHGPVKGGGSISGKYLSNDGKAIAVRPPGIGSRFIGDFKGRAKAQRPLKGGGSVSGQMWNNDGKPIEVKPPYYSNYGDYSGAVRLSRFKRNYVKNPNANDLALKKQKPHANTFAIGGLTTKEKRPPYVHNPHAVDEALLKRKPGENNFKIGGLTTKEKRPSYVRNPHAAKESLLKRKPGANTFAIGGLTTKEKSPNYVHNPSSHSSASKTISPGKAYAKLKDYQGNLKMKKFNDSRFHPDSQFAHGNRDNVKAERSLKTNIKLFWAKLFKKNDGQPEIVKEKEHVPRYDRKEKDLWKALYD